MKNVNRKTEGNTDNFLKPQPHPTGAYRCRLLDSIHAIQGIRPRALWVQVGIALVSLLLFFSAQTSRGQGALINGWMHTGSLSVTGAVDTWTFSANAGDSMILRVGKITQTNSFTPRITL